tara:strand:+ start:708 stop:1355 length:648 start_codon:yes stop_codon:yes gene_type:complete
MSKGKEKLKESLSALMDNEASEFEFRRVLKESAVDHEIKLKWQRYHLISAAIKGECGNSPAQHSRQPDLLARINAELDGESSQHILTAEAYPNEQSANSLHFGIFKRLGQGAIAASVAALVLIAVNPLLTQSTLENGLQTAGQETVEANVPVFDGDYAPTEFSRVPRLSNEIAGMEEMDTAARDRLRQAVYQEFVGEPQQSIELPVNFSVNREAE